MDNNTTRKLKVVAVGGGGCNLAAKAASLGMAGVEFVCIDTDRSSLEKTSGCARTLIGPTTTRGEGAGRLVSRGSEAAAESGEEIRAALEGAERVILISCIGGGTGGGTTPEVAKIAREMGIATIAIATRPFDFEPQTGNRETEERIKENVDLFFPVDNQSLLDSSSPETPMSEVMQQFDTKIANAIAAAAALGSDSPLPAVREALEEWLMVDGM